MSVLAETAIANKIIQSVWNTIHALSKTVHNRNAALKSGLGVMQKKCMYESGYEIKIIFAKV